MKVYIKNHQRSKRFSQQRIKKDIGRALRLLGFQKAELSILFVNSRKMRLLNARYRGIDKITDVLSFPQNSAKEQKCRSTRGELKRGEVASDCNLLGDIVICTQRASSQAEDYGVTFHDELFRLIIHGLLHLLGYDHELNSYQRKKMEKKEREIFNALKAMA